MSARKITLSSYLEAHCGAECCVDEAMPKGILLMPKWEA
jgi:hypothetical protein